MEVHVAICLFECVENPLVLFDLVVLLVAYNAMDCYKKFVVPANFMVVHFLWFKGVRCMSLICDDLACIHLGFEH